MSSKPPTKVVLIICRDGDCETMTLVGTKRKARSTPRATPSLQMALLTMGVVSFVLSFGIIGIIHHQTNETLSTQPHWMHASQHHVILTQQRNVTTGESSDPRLGKERLVDVLNTMNFSDMVEEATWKAIPQWSEITKLYGTEPVVVGLEGCQEYREKVAEEDRLIGPAGLFNTGTNLLAELLKQNCYIAARVKKMGVKRGHGMLWQVPWGKHTPLDLSNNTIQEAQYKRLNKDHILPVVAIREPYEWFNSMCHNNYVARWPHRHRCPNLIFPNKTYITVMMQYFHGSIKQYHTTLAHLWNDWNRQYFVDNLTIPRLVVRHKDLIFYPKELTKLVCDCAGGVFRDKDFSYVMDSAKPNRKGAKPFDGLVGNWIKYGKAFHASRFPKQDMRIAKEVLDQDIMNMFGFKEPP